VVVGVELLVVVVVGAILVVEVGPVVVVVGAVVVVLVVVTTGPVVVVDPPPPTAITGAMGLAEGVVVVMPEGVTVLLGYAVHVSDRGAPDTVSVRLADESSWTMTWLLVAVNPLTVAAVEGSDRVTPSAGTGLGMGTLKLSGPSGVVAGTAPLASICAVAEPSRLGCRDAAALANISGRFTIVW